MQPDASRDETNWLAAHATFSGGGEMGALMRTIDWAKTPVGSAETWPQSLKIAVRILMQCQLPMYIAWGQEFTQFYNDAYRPILGDKHPAALGISAQETWPEIWSTIGPMWAEVWQGKSFGFDNFKLTIDRFGYPEDCYFNFSYSPVPDDAGNVAGILVTFTETTEKVLLEKRLQANANQLSRIFKHAPVGIAVLRGSNFVFEFANERYLELVGHRLVVGKSVQAALPELAGQGIYELLDVVYTTGQPYIGRIQVMLNRGQPQTIEECFFEVVYQPLPDEYDKTDSIVVVAFEVTEISNAQREAELANRAKDEFLAMLGHELRNPLAPILTALNLMRLRGISEVDKERTVIERQVHHLVGLVDDLLDVSRLARGKLTLQQEPLELAAIVAEAVEQCSPLLEQRRHNLTIRVPSTGLMIEADPRRLAQVIANLLNNAAKYTEPGGEISILAERVDSEVWLRVSDTGNGIAPELLPKVFDLFYQEQQSIERSQGGLGLGLAIVKNLVTLHGGRVSAASAGKGQGSEFSVWLPLAPQLAQSEKTLADIPAPTGQQPLRILIVDDNMDAAEVLAISLNLCGHITEVAYDGLQGLEIAQSFLPDIAVLDIGLPGMDGYELARRLRHVPALSQIRLLALSGYGQPEDRDRSRQAGFAVHLVKPVDLTELSAALSAN
ncbi:ATP-binding protein [Trichocoleus sp. FACHB-262]|uniref:ATP-binding protein n=1 Tax=Trichocoleus sp. FACHB-262 TaxID=2692869 RepID=UPI0018F03E1A|nr:ATP-binding protein [Trichocoleus sp. FACHB-262]